MEGLWVLYQALCLKDSLQIKVSWITTSVNILTRVQLNVGVNDPLGVYTSINILLQVHLKFYLKNVKHSLRTICRKR